VTAALSLAAPAVAGRMEHVENRTETKRFALAAVSGQREVVVDNVIGSITVRGGSGDAIELTVKESFAAESAAELERAKREVELEVRESAGRIELVQGGSWRCRGGKKGHRLPQDDDWSGDGCCCDRWEDRDYEVRFDWTVVVPRDVDLTVKSVNDGAIHVQGVNGRLRVRHVNDDVTIADVAGRVDAKTVNGELKVDFRAQPSGDSTFATVNGDIDLGFPKGLGAKLTFATLNGEVYTDFPFTLATNPPPPPIAERESGRRGRKHHALGRRTAATLGQGGHALDCDTVNGDITIRERG
jgi:hypothetical protein